LKDVEFYVLNTEHSFREKRSTQMRRAY